MSDSRLYIILKPSEIINDIEIYSASASRPPVGILKKIYVNTMMGNYDLIKHVDIFKFVLHSVTKYSAKLDFQLRIDVLELCLCGGYLRVERPIEDLNELYDWFQTSLKQKELDVSTERHILKLLASIDPSIGNASFIKFVGLLEETVNKKLEGPDIRSEYVYLGLRLIQKLDCINKDNKIYPFFEKLVSVINRVDDIKVLIAVSNTIMDLLVSKKYPTLTFQLSPLHTTKLLAVINNYRTNRIGENLDISSIFALLMRNEEQHMLTDIIICVKPFILDHDVSTAMSAIKCMVYHLDRVSHKNDGLSYDRHINELLESYETLLIRVKDNRIMLFNCLRNLIILVIKYSEGAYKKDTLAIQKLLESIKIDLHVDKETYIIDTKLEILYLLAVRDIEYERIFELLEDLITNEEVSNDISYKTICTIGNIMNNTTEDKRYSYILNHLIDDLDLNTNLLCISVFFKNSILKGKYDLLKIKGYIEKVKQCDFQQYITSASARDEDILCYVWILGETKERNELVQLAQYMKEKHDLILLDVYINALAKVYNAQIVDVLASLKGLSLVTDRKIEFYLQLIRYCAETDQNIDEFMSMKEDSKVFEQEESSGLQFQSQQVLCDELGTILDSVCCVYLRSENNVFHK